MKKAEIVVRFSKRGDGTWRAKVDGLPGLAVDNRMSLPAASLAVLRSAADRSVDWDAVWQLVVARTHQLRVVGA